MADIAVPKDDVENAECTFKNCSQPNDETAYYTLICGGDEMLSVSRCVADTFEDTGALDFMGAMWSRGGDSSMTPMIRLRDYTWTDPFSNDTFTVYAVHTVSDAQDVAWNECPANNGYGSLAILCHTRSEFTDNEMAAMTIPAGSAWVTTWLEDEFAVDTGVDSLVLILIIIGSVLLVALTGIGWYCWRRRSKRKAEYTAPTAYALGVASPEYVGGGTPDLVLALRGTTASTRPTAHSSIFSHSGDFEKVQAPTTLSRFSSVIITSRTNVSRTKVSRSRNLYQKERLEKFGWVCTMTNKSQSRDCCSPNQKAENVQAFAEEIELSASLVHDNIVEFIGVAWNSLTNLVMVIEFFPKGNLQNYLHKNIDLLSWARDKIHMAVAIAHALHYLHSRTPAIIHRDLKSNNILLTDQLEPKLIDFGVSRGLVDLTMTAGVGTPYWTAPEILEGRKYTEQADIYSFGVVLSELDTGRIPYFDAVTEDGSGKAKPFHILQNVMAGALRPSFSRDCPPRIQRVGLACLAFDPLCRPTSRQLVEDLQGNSAELVYSF